MVCKKVLPLLSEYFDEALDADANAQVSQHLDRCIQCRKELDRLSALHDRLRTLNGLQAPEYLRRFVQHRITNMQQDSWRVRLQNELERCWSKIRTTEQMWYVTKALGTVMTSIFFFVISSTFSPYIYDNTTATEKDGSQRPYLRQVSENVLMKIGMIPAQAPVQASLQAPKLAVARSKPAINDLYLQDFGESISKAGNDYDFSVVTYVDPSGLAKTERVLEHPNAQSFLDNFNKVISSGRFAPAKQNGEAVPSHMILMFSKISVYD